MGWLWWIGAALALGILEMLSLDWSSRCSPVEHRRRDRLPLRGHGARPVRRAALTSVLLLFTLRPWLLRHLRDRMPLVEDQRRGARGREAVVVSTVTGEGGRVKLAGEVWSARVDAAQTIPPGTEVLVTR